MSEYFRVAVVSDDPLYDPSFVREFQNWGLTHIRGADLFECEGEWRVAGEPLLNVADCFVAQFSNSSRPRDRFLYSVAHGFKASGVPLLNSPQFVLECGDKQNLRSLAASLNIPQPMGVFVSPARRSNTTAVVEEVKVRLGFPVIVKPIGGLGGWGVQLVDNEMQLVSALDIYEAGQLSCLIQEFIGDGREDIRILLTPDKIIAAVRRRAGSGYKSNSAARLGGATSVVVEDLLHDHLVGEQVALIMPLLDQFDWDVAAVDWLLSGDRYVLNEINTWPGQSSLGVRAQGAYASAVYSRIQRAVMLSRDSNG